MNRTQKHETVEGLRDVFSRASSVVIVHQTGLDAAQTTSLRRKMRDAGATYRVAKNRLTRRALEGTPYAGLADLFTGPTAIAYSDDPVMPAKIVADFAKTVENRIVILGGAMGEKTLDPAAVKRLAELPSLDELRAKLVGLLKAPATKIAALLQAPGAQLARVVAARARSADGE